MASIKKQTLEALIREFKGNDLALHLTTELEKIEQIEREITRIRNAKTREFEAHRQRMANLDTEISKIQEKCQHFSKTYHGDPAGGSDSFYRCDHCEKTL